MSFDLNVTQASDVIFVTLNEETVLLNTKTEHYYGLTDVAGRMWELIGEGKTSSQIVSQLASEYHADEQTIQSDLDSFVTRLIAANLLIQESESHAA